jgi:hypothetical protein
MKLKKPLYRLIGVRENFLDTQNLILRQINSDFLIHCHISKSSTLEPVISQKDIKHINVLKTLCTEAGRT